MKAKLFSLNNFRENLRYLRLNFRRQKIQNKEPPDVEICRTVFADNPPVMDYNDHKHKNIVGNS